MDPEYFLDKRAEQAFSEDFVERLRTNLVSRCRECSKISYTIFKSGGLGHKRIFKKSDVLAEIPENFTAI